MKTRTTILTVVGARPQFVKAAAVSRAIRASADFREVLVHTGQHFDANMSDVFFSELDIPPPEEHFAPPSGTSHGVMTGRMLESVEGAILKHAPDWVMVYGDTNSTLAGALAAAKLRVPVVHVEAGLRSFNRRMPEEINRVVADHVSTLLLAPTRVAVENLAKEGITGSVRHVGDVMHDAMLHAMVRARTSSRVLDELGLKFGEFVLATVHRAENTDNAARLAAVFAALKREAAARAVVLPLHPRTRQALECTSIDTGAIRIINPVGYMDMAHLLESCALVMTDSGGLQKEAYFARRPCVTLRDETEWVETIEHGWNRLWTSPEWKTPRSEIADYGKGDAAERVLAAIRGWES
jgi:UDP-GlcNAc3NAcA epimerase